MVRLDWKNTSVRGTRGGPEAIFAALVPGRIRRDAPLSGNRAGPRSFISPADLSIPGDGGASWTSGYGGGLGRRGEDCGEMLPGAADNEDMADLRRAETEKSTMSLKLSALDPTTASVRKSYLPSPQFLRQGKSPNHSW